MLRELVRLAEQSWQVYDPEAVLEAIRQREEMGSTALASGVAIPHPRRALPSALGESVLAYGRTASGIPVGAGPEELRKLLGQAPHTRYPIYEGDLDHIVGMYHIKDLLRLLLNGQRVTAAGSRSIPMLPETALLDDVLATMRRERAQFAIVIDEHGGTSGVVTLEDLFEEVVGDIEEGPATAAAPHRDARGRVRVPGTMRLDELGQIFDLELSHEDVDSVSGLILTLLGRPPNVGDAVVYERLRLEVAAVKGHGVDEAAVWLLPA